MSQFFLSGGQSIGASASWSALPMSIQGCFPLRLIDLISLLSKGLLSLLQHHSLKAPILLCPVFFMVQLSHSYMTTGKTTALTLQTFVNCNPPGSSVHGILQARILERVTIPFPQPNWTEFPGSGDKPMSPALTGRFFTTEPPRSPILNRICFIMPTSSR